MTGQNTIIYIYLYALILFTSIIIYQVYFYRLYFFLESLLA